MKINTASGVREINKRSAFGRFFLGYYSSGAWTGNATIAAAWTMAKQIHHRFPSISWYDAGRLTAANFNHKPSDAYLEEITGVQMER